MKLLGVEEARSRMLAEAVRVRDATLPLADALGGVLRTDVVATRDQPPFAASAMDGWAVRAADGAARLRIVGESAAGHGYAEELRPGEAVRIFTGAAIPSGADAVVIQEDAVRDGDFVTVPGSSDPRHVRPRGLDFRAGTSLLRAGTRLDAWRLGLAAASGAPTVTVAAPPQVALLSTGEEVVAPGSSPGPFQIFNSGNTSLGALVRSWGGGIVPLDIIGDDEAAIAEAAGRAGGDLLVTIGGASVGDHDLVKPALSRLGLRMVGESVAVRPGKPTWFAVLADGRRVLGLPGNPASALVCAELFLRPLLMAMQGGDPEVRLVHARTTTPLESNGPREHWMRAKLAYTADGALTATPLGDQDSSLVTVFASADALLRRRPGAAAAGVGDPVDVLPLARA